jgi:hypothetical protein
VLTNMSAGTAANITLEVTGSIDASGGKGNLAGSARNDSGAGVSNIASNLAVRFDAGTGGTVTNLGSIVARGPAQGGDGGDILFIGNGTPLPGTQNRMGDGVDGDFSGQ